jgi:ABC-type amino acid transport substrate-binding protein
MSEGSSGAALKGCILLGFLGAVLVTMGAAGAMLFVKESGSSPGTVVAPDPRDDAAKDVQPVTAPVAAGATLDRIRARGHLLIGMDTGEPPWTGTPPMFQMNEQGGYDGFDFALAQRIASEIGVAEVKIVHTKYSGLEELLLDESAKVDLIASGYSPTDTAGIAWSQPYLEYGLCLVVPAKSKVKTVADLFGKPIGIFDDDAAAEDVQKLVKGYTELVRLEDGYWDQLASGRFAGFLYDYPYAVAEIRDWYAENPSRAGSLRIAQYNLTDSTYAVGVRAGEADLLAAVNSAIGEWRESDAYGEAVKAYLKGGEAVAAPVGEGKVVKVEKGDTLSLIAKRELGDVGRWPEIWEKNRDRFPNPHLIEVGDEVVLP